MVDTVTREEDHLMVQTSGQAKEEVFPENETTFFVKGAGLAADLCKGRTWTSDLCAVSAEQAGFHRQKNTIVTLIRSSARHSELVTSFQSIQSQSRPAPLSSLRVYHSCRSYSVLPTISRPTFSTDPALQQGPKRSARYDLRRGRAG